MSLVPPFLFTSLISVVEPSPVAPTVLEPAPAPPSAPPPSEPPVAPAPATAPPTEVVTPPTEPAPVPVPASSPPTVAPPTPAPVATAPAAPPPVKHYRLSDEDERMKPDAGDPEKIKFTPGKGVELRSKDNRWLLQTSLRTGFLYTVVHPNVAGTDTTQTFEIRRFRLNFAGHVFNEHNKFLLQLAFAPRELDLRDGVIHGSPLWDAYMNFDRFENFTLRIGQYRPQYSRERLIQDINPLLIDRSLSNMEFNLDRDIGFDFRSEDFMGWKKLRYFVGMFMGEGRDFRDPGDFGFLYTARVDFLPFGLFDDYESSDQERSSKFRLSFGAAYAFADKSRKNRVTMGPAPTDGGTTDHHNATADLLMKWAGWYLETGVLWRHGVRTPGDALDPVTGDPLPIELARNGLGWFAQTAYLIPKTRLEPAFRYSEIRALRTTALVDRSEMGGGLNYYFRGHALKLQFDYLRSWQQLAFADGVDQFRVQLQVAF